MRTRSLRNQVLAVNAAMVAIIAIGLNVVVGQISAAARFSA